jgi:protein-S-isoprenylcysteine O-methyltransferase Ste14
MHWSEAHLGRLFSVQAEIQQGHRLVTDGPFRHLRHPRYAGVLLFLSGIALVFRSWLALALVVPVLAVLLWRIADEEALLRETFGPEWDAYAGRTRRLLPFAW